jgi:phosphoadenosine phosphosulfate reductase
MSTISVQEWGRAPDVSPQGDASSNVAETADQLAGTLGQLATPDQLARLIRHEFPGRIALVSSFGAEAAALLHMIAAVDPAVPVIFLDTGKLFGETLRYRDRLVEFLGLRDVRSIAPQPVLLSAEDPHGVLWRDDPDRCCFLRKVEPLERALEGFDAWFNGRKRYHGGERASLPLIEAVGGRIKVNPLSGWAPAQIEAYFATHALPRHPLVEDGFASIGCMPCSDRVAAGEETRAGRWRGRDKSECGIHVNLNIQRVERKEE